MFKFDHLVIRGINGIDELFLSFTPGVNIISGPNGIGKSTILNCLNASVRGIKKTSKLNAGVAKRYGSWEINYLADFKRSEETFSLQPLKETTECDLNIGKYLKNKEFIYFNVESRNFHNGMFGQSRLLGIKKWFFDNYYTSNISSSKYHNMSLIKEIFRSLDPNVSFSRVIELPPTLGRNYSPPKRNFELYLETKHGEIIFENLSSGYTSCLSILLGIVRSIESVQSNYVQDFDGTVLIDELDLHLHPEWQGKIIKILKWLIPGAQIIATTHSPHIIQSVDYQEIIALTEDKNGYIYTRNIPSVSHEFGYQGWTIEEILSEVMGLKNPMSDNFIQTLQSYNKAKRGKNREDMKKHYINLSKMIHPNNPLLKLLSIQSGELSIWEGIEIDKN